MLIRELVLLFRYFSVHQHSESPNIKGEYKFRFNIGFTMAG